MSNEPRDQPSVAASTEGVARNPPLSDSPTGAHLRVPPLGDNYLEVARRRLFARHPEYLPYLAHRLDIYPGMTVVDVGCGTGAYTRLMASRLAGAGAAIGIDSQPQALALANQAAQQEGWGPLIQFAIGEPTKLPIPDACADRVFCSSLLWRITDPIAVLREMRRVLRPGGRAVAAEPDGGLNLSYVPDQPRLTALEARFQECYARGVGELDGQDYDIGRRLPALFLSAGFVAVRAFPRLFVSAGCDLGNIPQEGLRERLQEYQQALLAMRAETPEARAAREHRSARARAGGMNQAELDEYDQETLRYLLARVEDPRRILEDGATYMYGGVFCEGVCFVETPDAPSAQAPSA